ncbi:MAG: hypothetical protein NZ772_00235 [Cyanobacteria bacterium]|nr:hypothetical protein [Cyanobacteriota bacterium]MDW8199593.1 hypothetical protein [Cyanobacteriota bacterium SKYGB_h_bin112]
MSSAESSQPSTELLDDLRQMMQLVLAEVQQMRSVLAEVQQLRQDVESYRHEVAEYKQEVLNYKQEVLGYKQEVSMFNDKFETYQKATQWVVQLAFSLIAAATVTIVVSSVFNK